MNTKRLFTLALALLFFPPLSIAAAANSGDSAGESTSTADHSKFEALQRDFDNGPAVTKACLSCHTEAAKQIHQTQHWTWNYLNPDTGQQLGKQHVVNNFCTATASNMGFCAACHVGYGFSDESFDFAAEENVDCIVCHDTTGTYKKLPGLAGHPNYRSMEWPPHSGNFREPPDLTKVAQSVGRSSRASCGACHFFGGGGNAVKHGDLDSSLTQPKRYLDVHMEAQGLDFSCAQCHATENHQVPGSRYAPTAKDTDGIRVPGQRKPRNPASCHACHGDAPHPAELDRLNQHGRKLACQTCHIPEYARGDIATKMTWDWSTAGKLDADGRPFKVRGSEGRTNYDSKKGDFSWEKNVIPEYQWFNGKVRHTLFEDRIDPNTVVKINEFGGGPDDGESRIWPVKVMRGKQPYDAGQNRLALAHTAGKDDAAYWSSFDWGKAIKVGMASRGVEYSGEMGFVETEMRWPINHMVAPKQDALQCEQCHRKNGRLEAIEGVYIPGRDRLPWLDRIGFSVALLTLIGVLGHGLGRYVAARRRG